jgi:hypothetical protein
MEAEEAVQVALFQAIGALGYPTYDVAPQRGAWPDAAFVVIGEVVFAPLDTKDRNGFDLVARIHTRHEADNLLPVKRIQGAIYRRLHNGDLTIPGHRLILLRRVLSDVTREAQGQIHGVCEYRGLIETT